MKSKRFGVVIFTAVVMACLTAQLRADSIGLNFVDGRRGGHNNQALGAGQSAGVVPQINWNNTSANTANPGAAGTTANIVSPTAGTLVDNTGANSGASVSWAGETTWSADAENAIPDDVMMSNFLLTENNVGIDASVTVSDLTYDSYDVYVYFGGSFGDSGRAGTISLNGTEDVDVESLAFSGGPFDEATGGGDPGNYVLFSDVMGDSFTVSLDAEPSSTNFHMGIFGVQVVDTTIAASVPEPMSLIIWMVVGMTTLGYITWRRQWMSAT